VAANNEDAMLMHDTFRHIPIPPEEWPHHHQEAWRQARHQGDVLDPGGPASTLRRASQAMAEIGWGLWLSYLKHEGLLQANMAITDELTPAMVKKFVQTLVAGGNSGMTAAIRVGELALMLSALAQGGDWLWLHQIENAIRQNAVPVRNKTNRMRSSKELFGLGVQMMAMADDMATKRDSTTPAILFRDGLAISLLALRPLRLANFSSIVLGRHLVREDDGWWLKFTRHETKTHRDIEVPFPLALESALRRYLDIHRKILLGPSLDTGNLWLSGRDDAPLTEGGMKLAIVKRTKMAFGKSVNPHLFRDCAATSLALADPEYVWLAAILLGHSNLNTTERHYIQATTREAADILNASLFGETPPSRRSSVAQRLAAAAYLTNRPRRRQF
jgi:integrase/recombinase XerD